MTRTIVLWSCAAALAAANPIALTLLNEFGFDDDGLGWVELHAEPAIGSVNMSGWLLMTSTSACTFDYTLPYDGFLIVDSASLARGLYAHGTFRLSPSGDRMRVVADSMHPEFDDEVEFPVLPAGDGRAPMPPDGGSASVLNVPAGWWQSINWYIDSTPTRELDNDDYSTVAGIVTWAPERNLLEVDIVLSGPMGASFAGVYASGESYQTPGLSAGRYAATARGWPSGASASYPESVDVGYSGTVHGINIDFDPSGVKDRHPFAADRLPRIATVVRGYLSLPANLLTAHYSLLTADGRKVLDLQPGANDVSRLAPGVYFVRGQWSGGGEREEVRKIVIQR